MALVKLFSDVDPFVWLILPCSVSSSIENSIPRFVWHDITETIRKAFSVWAKVVPFTFRYIPYTEIERGLRYESEINIIISFQAGPHKGHDPFGPEELAHASSPPNPLGDPGIPSFVHFNLDKIWTISKQEEGKRMCQQQNVFTAPK